MIDGLSVLLRALGFIALFEALGGALYLTLFGAALPRAGIQIRRRLRWVAVIAILLVLAHFGWEAARLAGDPSGVWDLQMQHLSWQTAPGSALRLKELGLLLVLAGLLVPSAPAAGAARAVNAALCVGGLAIVVAGFASTGHTVDQPHRFWLVALLAAHLASIAFWFGALWPLVQVVRLETPERAAQLLERFSRLAIWIVPALLWAGATLVILLVPGVSVLGQPYGQLLVVKVAAFCVLMILAGLNKLRLTPALRRQDPTAVPRLRRSLLVEYLIIAAVLAVTAVLTGLYSPE